MGSITNIIFLESKLWAFHCTATGSQANRIGSTAYMASSPSSNEPNFWLTIERTLSFTSQLPPSNQIPYQFVQIYDYNNNHIPKVEKKINYNEPECVNPVRVVRRWRAHRLQIVGKITPNKITPVELDNGATTPTAVCDHQCRILQRRRRTSPTTPTHSPFLPPLVETTHIQKPVKCSCRHKSEADCSLLRLTGWRWAEEAKGGWQWWKWRGRLGRRKLSREELLVKETKVSKAF